MDMIDKAIDSIIESLLDVDHNNCIYTLNKVGRRILRERMIEVFKEYDRL